MALNDMLVKLYELETDWRFISEQKKNGIIVRKPIAPESLTLQEWVQDNFSNAWMCEVKKAQANLPVSCFIAQQENTLLGFACYDAAALGFFGPLGVLEQAQGRGIGASLSKACMLDMKLKGYGYAIIGMTDTQDFYQKVVNAVAIPNSYPGIYSTMLCREQENDAK